MNQQFDLQKKKKQLKVDINEIWTLKNDGIKSLIFLYMYANIRIHWNLLDQIKHWAVVRSSRKYLDALYSVNSIIFFILMVKP